MAPRNFFLLLSFLFCFQNGMAQELKNIMAEFQGDKMKVTYDLLCDNAEQEFTLSVYSSHDDFQSKLSNVIGDVGNNVLPGRGKTITWYLLTELPTNFDETIQLKLVASPVGVEKPVAKKMRFLYPGENTRAKKGKTFHISWEGTSPDNNYLLELYSGNTKRADLARISSEKGYTWKIPKQTEKGKNYKLKLTSRENSMDYIISPEFEIKGGMSPALIAIPVAVAAGVTYFVLGSGGEDGNNGGPVPLTDLPPPIEP